MPTITAHTLHWPEPDEIDGAVYWRLWLQPGEQAIRPPEGAIGRRG